MLKIIKKLAYAIITIFIIVTISFLLIHLMPGESIINLVGQEEYYRLLEHDPALLEQMKIKYGLNDSLFVQYIKYLKSIITLDFGLAYSNRQPVIHNVFRAMKNTLILSVPNWILGTIFGCILGTIAGWKPKSIFDKISTSFFIFINTIPSNCLGLIFLIIFAYRLKILPVNGMVSPGLDGFEKFLSYLKHMILPLSILVLGRTSSNFMLMKSAVSQVRKEEYITTAVSKGLSDKKILFIHVLKNALVPYSTSIVMQLGFLLSGSAIIEVVFGWKGMGYLMYEAVTHKDFPTAQFCFLITAVTVVFANLLSDIVNMWIDPRIKEESYE